MPRWLYEKIGDCSAFIAKFWGLLEGLKLTKTKSLTVVGVNLDSQLIVNAINIKDNDYLMGRNPIMKIRGLLSHDWNVQIKHVYQETNYCKNILVRRKINLHKCICTFDAYPTSISYFVVFSGVTLSFSYINPFI